MRTVPNVIGTTRIVVSSRCRWCRCVTNATGSASPILTTVAGIDIQRVVVIVRLRKGVEKELNIVSETDALMRGERKNEPVEKRIEEEHQDYAGTWHD